MYTADASARTTGSFKDKFVTKRDIKGVSFPGNFTMSY
jgi:hypothetical protein